jgi:hypothetical protein
VEPMEPMATRRQRLFGKCTRKGCEDGVSRAGHNFRCPLLSALSVVPLVNGTTVMFQF